MRIRFNSVILIFVASIDHENIFTTKISRFTVIMNECQLYSDYVPLPCIHLHWLQALLADQAEALMEEAEELISLIPVSIP